MTGEHRGVDRGQMRTGVEDEDGPFRRRPVQVVASQAFLVDEVDRIETPDHDGFRRPLGFLIEASKQIEQLVIGLHAGSGAAVRTVPGKPSGVGQQAERPLKGVSVSLDHAGSQHVVRKTVIHGVRTPAGAFVERAGSEDFAVAHGNCLDGGLAWVHRHDGAGGENGGVGHGVLKSVRFSPAEWRHRGRSG